MIAAELPPNILVSYFLWNYTLCAVPQIHLYSLLIISCSLFIVADLHNLTSTPHTSSTSSTSQHHIPTQQSSLNGGTVLNIMHGSGGGLTNVSQLTGGYEHKQLHKEHEDVEMMSSDSSSSSSSDE